MASAPHFHDNEKASSAMNEHSLDVNRQISIQLSNEQYERLFFQPGGPAKSGDLSNRFGNPTGLAIICFLLCLTPTSCILMGWRGATVTSLATLIGVFYFLGGLGMMLAALFEWILGNTFPCMVFATFSGFWLSLAVLNDPAHSITSVFAQGTTERDYNSSIAFYFIFWSITCFIYFLASLRTNIVFAEIFFTLIFAYGFLAAGYDKAGHGQAELSSKYIETAGAFAFATCMGGWYLFTSLLFDAVKMPFVLPVGDLSGFLSRKGGNTRA